MGSQGATRERGRGHRGSHSRASPRETTERRAGERIVKHYVEEPHRSRWPVPPSRAAWQVAGS
jgi:hypothetical protein